MKGLFKTSILTFLAMLAFASNSYLCRVALVETNIDPVSFTCIRLFSAACLLLFIKMISTKGKTDTPDKNGDWFSAISLFVYALGFSFAYITLSTGTGALLLFGAVQMTMLVHAIVRGERVSPGQWIGFVIAFAGLIYLLLPHVESPPLESALLMILSGAAWGIYSIRGRGADNALLTTFGNFSRSLIPALVLGIFFFSKLNLEIEGVLYAAASGALASGLGYVIWYAALPSLSTVTAASVQLSVPIIAALAGLILLGESVNFRLAVSSITILGGILLIILFARTPSGGSSKHL